MARYRDEENPAQIISLWMRTHSTISYIGLWEKINNPGFKPHIYEEFKIQSAEPSFWMSPQKWIKETNAIGIISKIAKIVYQIIWANDFLRIMNDDNIRTIFCMERYYNKAHPDTYQYLPPTREISDEF
jgi:hypothetical protein